MHRRIIIFITLLTIFMMNCTSDQSGKDKVSATVSFTIPASSEEEENEKIMMDDHGELQDFLNSFSSNIQAGQYDQLAAMMNFPFYTARTGDEQLADDPVSLTDFAGLKKSIYHADVQRLFPTAKNGTKIESGNDMAAYYKEIGKAADPGCLLYEVYSQYPEKGNHAESYFAFIFGRVKGKFKVLSYYGKWPVK